MDQDAIENVFVKAHAPNKVFATNTTFAEEVSFLFPLVKEEDRFDENKLKKLVRLEDVQ